MRIVRFHLEPWQKGGSEVSTPCESPSLLLVTASVHRRQRSVDINDIPNVDSLSETERRRREVDKSKWRYPQIVKRLSILCSDVIASNVQNTYSSNDFSLFKLSFFIFSFSGSNVHTRSR